MLKHQEILAPYTSWHIGGPAEIYFRPQNLGHLQEYLSSLAAGQKLTWLGLGSNVLINDNGINGVLIHTLNALKKLELDSDGLIYTEAGVTCAKFSKFAAKQGFVGAEFFSGIPGTMGGALRMNAGAWGGETWEHLIFADLINTQGEIKRYLKEDFEIFYRHIQFPKSITESLWFVGAAFAFKPGDTLAAETKIKALLQERQQKQPIGTHNCGSVFKNPPGHHAAVLINQLNLKNYRIGNAVVSEKHANFIINLGQARAQDVLELVKHIESEVFKAYGIVLEREFKILS
ncbi:MAG: UDP-N-acetylmuramate dehydrogenase [Gammaproteobacteria bacterium]